MTQSVFAEFGIEAEGAVMDPDPLLGARRRDPRLRAGRGAPVVPHRVALRHDAPRPRRVGAGRVRGCRSPTSRSASTTTRSAGTSPTRSWSRRRPSPRRDLLGRLKSRAAESPHRYTFICPRSGQLSREEVCERLARTLAEMYRADIDATGQPMSPAPFAAVQNAIEHYRVDEILISTLAGEQSVWLEEGPDRPRARHHRQARRARRGGRRCRSARRS